MSQITNQYWVVNDTNPTTQVWSSPVGQMVVNTDATFEAWLNAADGRADVASVGRFLGTSSGAGGVILVQVDTTAFIQTGQVFNYVGNNSGAFGAAAITVVDATHFSINGSVFSVADTSATIWAATIIDTAADLYQAIDSSNRGSYKGGATANLAISGNTTLTNPLPQFLNITNSGALALLVLPLMNVPGSIPIGVPITISCDGASAAGFRIRTQDGVTNVKRLYPGDQVTLALTSNATQNGTFARAYIPAFLLSAAQPTNDATIPVGQTAAGTPAFGTWVAPSGDVSMDDTGKFTVTGVNGVALPVGVVNGGTGLATLTAHAVMLGEGTSNVAFAAIGTAGRLLIDQGAGADPGFKAASGDVSSISAAGAFTLASTITAGGPTGDASHVAQITYDAKGRLTAVTSVSIAPTLQGYLGGLGLSNDAGTPNTILDIASGVCCSDDATTMMNLAAFTKTTGAWAVGSGNGGLDTGSVANTTWYHVFIIERTDTGVVDVLFSTSATAPTMPTNYTKKRRVGSFLTDGSAHILVFVQDGDVFRWDLPVQDYNANNPGTSAVTVTLASVPSGVHVFADVMVRMANTGTTATPNEVYISDLALTDRAPTAPVGTVGMLARGPGAVAAIDIPCSVRTNTSGQVRLRVEASDANLFINLNTLGWTDRRGAR